jgi:uncharacterized protein (DUF2164 family)
MSKAFKEKIEEYLKNKTTKPLGKFSANDFVEFTGLSKATLHRYLKEGFIEAESRWPIRITKEAIIEYMGK